MPQACPYCSYARSWILRRKKRKCKQCKREFSIHPYPIRAIRSTVFEWKACIKTFLRQRAGLTVSKETGIPHCRAVRMVHVLRTLMTQDVPKFFLGPLEFDETYIGGQRKNKRLHIRRIQAKRGHGTDKLAIMGIFDRSSKQVYIEVMPKKLNMAHIISVLKSYANIGTAIYTDGYKMYRGLTKEGFLHAYVDHDGGEYVRGNVHTNNIEGFWGILKRKLSCIGGMRRDRLYLFAGEITWRFNHRNQALDEQERLLFNLIIKFGGRS